MWVCLGACMPRLGDVDRAVKWLVTWSCMHKKKFGKRGICLYRNEISGYNTKVKAKVILRPTVSRPVFPGVRHPPGTRDQFFPLSLRLFLHSCKFVGVGRVLWREDGSVICSTSKSKSHYDRQSVGQSVLVSGAHLGPATNFSFSLRFSLDSCGFAIL
jgi:hypothetical protein